MPCIAKRAFQIATGKADKDSRRAGVIAFTLQAIKNLINLSHKKYLCRLSVGLFFLISGYIGFRFLHLDFEASRYLLAYPAGYILCGRIEWKNFIQITVI